MNPTSSVLRRFHSAACLTAALAEAASSADPYAWHLRCAAPAHDVHDVAGASGRGDVAAESGPGGPGDSALRWRSFADLLTDEALVDAWIRQCGGGDERCETGGAVTALRLCAPVIDLAVSLFVVYRWAVPLTSQDVLLALNPSGRVRGVALCKTAFVSEGSGPGGEADSGTLASYQASQLAALLQPAFQAVRARSRYGLRGMWGQAVDEIAIAAMRRARLLSLDQAAAWRMAAQLIDALAAVQPLVRRRPSAYAALWPGGQTTLAIKGSCCLYFKVSAQCDPEPHCSTCPLLDEHERAPRVARLLQREHERLYRRRKAA